MSTAGRLTLLAAGTDAVPGVPFDVDLDAGDSADSVSAWCKHRGWHLVSTEVLPSGLVRHRVRQGLGIDPIADLDPDRRPGARLWLYTNFHCNLACDYCCVSSSPKAARRLLSMEMIRRLADEASACGVQTIYITGGEPFLRSDIADIIAYCAAAAPTTVLTNAMLFAGGRRRWLDECPRENVVLQISLDSSDPALHDLHRGLGSHTAAVAGIMIAHELGFRLRIAATLDATDHDSEEAVHRFCDELGLDQSSRVIRRIARQGVATEGLTISRASVIPEICIADDKVWWHPVGATDPALQVFDHVPSLHDVITAVSDEFTRYRLETDLVAASFPCA